MIILIFILYLLIRIYPYIFSSIPLGYDPGLYLYLWQKYSEIPVFHFTKLSNWLIEVYPPLIAVVGKIGTIFFSPESLLIPFSFIASVLLFVSIYKYSKIEFDKKTSFWILFLLTISAVQYKFWWWYYVKNILAISFIFFYLYFDLIKSKWKWVFIPLVVLTHQPTAIIFFIILIFKKKINPILVFILTFVSYYLPNYETTIKPFLQSTVTTVGEASGTFYDLSEAMLLMIPYLPLTIYGIYLSIKRKTNKLIIKMTVISFLIPLFGLFLSRRFIPFFDLFAIILAGYGASTFFAKNKKFIIIYIVISFIFMGEYIRDNSKPLILKDELNEIRLLSDTEEGSYILVADNEYTPWIYGYSNRKTIAPGFGENDVYWRFNEWTKFWMSNNRNEEIKLLKKLPKPLYIYLGDNQRQIRFKPVGSCFERYSWHVYKFVCN